MPNACCCSSYLLRTFACGISRQKGAMKSILSPLPELTTPANAEASALLQRHRPLYPHSSRSILFAAAYMKRGKHRHL